MNLESWLTGLLVAAALAFLCRRAVRALRQPRSTCGCPGPCGLKSRQRLSPGGEPPQ